MPLFIQKLCHRIPPPNDVLSSLDQPSASWLRAQSTARQLARNGLRAFTPERRGASHHRAMNTRRLLWLDLPSNGALGRIRFDAKVPQVLGEVLPPFAKGGFPDIQPLALFADRLIARQQLQLVRTVMRSPSRSRTRSIPCAVPAGS